MIIERRPLPGIGMCQTAVTARRQRLGVVCHGTGRRDLILHHPDDRQRPAYAVVLDPAEARHVAGMLAATDRHPWRRAADPKVRQRRPHTTAPPHKDQRG